MDARDVTTNNADLWTQYLRQQWNQFLDPFGLADPAVTETASRVFAEVAAANVSSFLTSLMAPAVGRMFDDQAAAFAPPSADERAERVEIPAAYAAATPTGGCVDATQREEWATAASPARETVAAY
jgi:hypothetical protein